MRCGSARIVRPPFFAIHAVFSIQDRERLRERVLQLARGDAPWAPSGVLVDPDGALWVLEYSTSNEARVRRIARGGQSTVF